MTKEKLQSMVKYASQLKEKLSSPTPPKHQHSPDTYKAFLTRELQKATVKIDAAKLANTEKGGK